MNIDPLKVASHDEVGAVLQRAGLWDHIVEKGGLEAKFDENLLRHGQQQLFSLARAVLRKSVGKMVLFDETTSRSVLPRVSLWSSWRSHLLNNDNPAALMQAPKRRSRRSSGGGGEVP